MSKEKEKQFFKELHELLDKHNAAIQACNSGIRVFINNDTYDSGGLICGNMGAWCLYTRSECLFDAAEEKGK